MNYLDKAKDYAVQWSVDRKGEHEFVFDQIGLEYFLDSLNIDFLAEPPKKEWIGLTDEEIFGIFGTYLGDPDYNHNKLLIDARRIEAKLKEKNGH